jgi:hypothetical protein
MKTGMLKIWIMMSAISCLVQYLYKWVIWDIGDLIKIGILLFGITGMTALLLGMLILQFQWTDKKSGWYIGTAIGLATLFVELMVITAWQFVFVTIWLPLLMGIVGVGLCVVLYGNYMSDTSYKKIWVSVFALLFLVGFGISVYLLCIDSQQSFITLMSTFGITLSIAVFDEIRYRKYNKSWFLQPD